MKGYIHLEQLDSSEQGNKTLLDRTVTKTRERNTRAQLCYLVRVPTTWGQTGASSRLWCAEGPHAVELLNS